jgi:Ser-tRNA(Ala) deacylase AlaX
MTKKVFWENPYLTQLDTRIASVKDNDVTLEETIFFAFSGGQESDAGTIGSYPVLEAHKADKEIIYRLPSDHELRTGDQVTIHIDWDRRYKLMRLHFAAEIILALVYESLDGIEKIGAHIAQDKARIDFQWDENISTIFPTILKQANALVDANREIVSAFSDEDNERRYWEISGFARVPCGGTHLRKTGEIGPMMLKRKNVGKGKERIEINVS